MKKPFYKRIWFWVLLLIVAGNWIPKIAQQARDKEQAQALAEIQARAESTSTDDAASQNDWYYTAEEQAEAEAAYREKVGYDTESEAPLQVMNDGIVTWAPSGSEYSTTDGYTDEQPRGYIVNTESKVFHNPGCARAEQIKSENLGSFNGTRSEAVAAGYQSCKVCKP